MNLNVDLPWDILKMRLTNYDLDEDEYVPRGMLSKQYPKGKYSSWVELDRGYRAPSHNAVDTLENGIYCFRIHRDQLTVKQEKLYSDELYELNDSIAELICNEYEKFIEAKEKYQKLRLAHRRGIFLHGSQGCGKTATFQRVVQHSIKHGGISFQMDVNPELFSAGLKMFRSIEPDRTAVCLMEDIDALIEKFGEASILSLLDGEAQIDGVFNLASSNYPEKLDKRLINRPRRFDRVIRVDKPNDSIRKQYIETKLALLGEVNEERVIQIIEATKGLSFSALTEFIISTEIMDIPLEEATQIIRKLEKNKPSSTEDKGRMGFD